MVAIIAGILHSRSSCSARLAGTKSRHEEPREGVEAGDEGRETRGYQIAINQIV